MSDRIASDHDAVDTQRARVTSVSRTGRLQVDLPDDLSTGVGDAIWCSLDEAGGYARVDESLDGTHVIRRVVTNRRQAREDDGTDRLEPWLDDEGLDDGDAVHLDVLTEGYAYGVRSPGERVVYRPPDPPDRSLTDIAREAGADARHSGRDR